jgi:hypothetical protein
MTIQFPKAYLAASATKSEAEEKTKKVQAAVVPEKTKTSARIDMSADVAGKGLCPECRKPMVASHANGIPVLVCDEHRIALPVEDTEPLAETGEIK